MVEEAHVGQRIGFFGNIGCGVRNSADPSVASLTVTTLSFDTEINDTDEMHDVAVNNSRLTFKTPGLYYIWGAAEFTANAMGIRLLRVQANGTGQSFGTRQDSIGANDAVQLLAEGPFLAEIGDFIELKVLQDSGAALTVSNPTTGGGPQFAAVKIIG